jgi:quinol monooxygenase YgiN
VNVLTLAHCEIRPGTRDEFLSEFTAYRSKVLAREAGTLVFDIYESCHKEDRFTIEERFLNEEARQAHLAADYHDEAVKRLHQYIEDGDAFFYVEQEA